MIKAAALLLLWGLLIYALYEGGLISVHTKRALMFIGKSERKASFRRCTGSIRRVVRLSEGETAAWRLHAVLTAGAMSVMLRGADGQELLRLDPAHPEGTVRAEKAMRCTLVVRFQAADGSYTLSRE